MRFAKIENYPLLKLLRRWRIICLNLSVQFVEEGSKVVSIIEPWSTGYGLRPSSSYKRPLIGTKQIKWNISFPNVDEPFDEEDAAKQAVVDDINWLEFKLVPNEDEAVAELDAYE